jgi:HSP20 family protein
MNLVTWDPYRELASMPDRFQRLFRRDRDEEISLGTWIPPVDIMEEKDRILLTAELPGFKENDIEVQMEGGVLTIRGERKSEAEKEGRKYHRVERVYGQFVRSFTLPNNVDREHIKATFDRGLLKIEMPKSEEAKPRQIKISGGDGEGKKETIDVKARNQS